MDGSFTTCELITQPTQRVGRMDGTNELIGAGTGEIILPVQPLICLVVFILAFVQCQKKTSGVLPEGLSADCERCGSFTYQQAQQAGRREGQAKD
jgi:hypothetical protein